MVIDNMVFFQKSFLRNKWTVYYFFGVKKNSYMGTIVSRIYDYYCRDAKNLFFEYKRFYSKEFSSYGDFLSNKYNLFDKEIEELSSPLLYCKDLCELSDYNLNTLCDDECLEDILQKFLGGNADEN